VPTRPRDEISEKSLTDRRRADAPKKISWEAHSKNPSERQKKPKEKSKNEAPKKDGEELLRGTRTKNTLVASSSNLTQKRKEKRKGGFTNKQRSLGQQELADVKK